LEVLEGLKGQDKCIDYRCCDSPDQRVSSVANRSSSMRHPDSRI
jgi:hypothetical protein